MPYNKMKIPIMSNTLESLDTPSLVVDLDLMEANLQKMAQFFKDKSCTLRPHTKAHKIPEIAKMQVAHGATGICTAKLGEAVVMAGAGLNDILITTPIANPIKIQRLIQLQKKFPKNRIIQVVDHVQHVKLIAEEAVKNGITINLVVEVECGQHRCGVRVGDDLLQISRTIAQTKGLRFTGVQAYTGHLQHVHGYTERREQARAAVQPLFKFIETEFQRYGFKAEIVSGGGTGTYNVYDDFGFTEIQAGSYVFMDADYRGIGSKNGDRHYSDFAASLKVWTTVISRPTPTRAIVDAGMKALSIDSGMPVLDGLPNIHYKSGGDEHGILTLPDQFSGLNVGDRVLLMPSHCDTTLNLFSKLYGIRHGQIEKEWTIEGRGRSD